MGNAHCEGSVVYGDWLFLSPTYSIPAGASPECQAILRTYQVMGAAVYDATGGWGAVVAAENPITYGSGSNPWYDKIEPDMNKAGEGSGSGQGWSFDSCFRYTTAADWNVLELNQAGTPALPSLSVAATQPQ